jgi:hypothetical protein
MWHGIARRLFMNASVKLLFGIAFLLVLLNLVAAILFSTLGVGFVGLVKVALLLTGAFALIGMAFMLARGLRRAKLR